MPRLTDLTGALTTGMWDYRALPGLENTIPPLAVDAIATVPRDGFFASSVTLSTITGTYLEAGAHILADGPTLDSYSVDDFIRPARIARLGDLPADTVIDGDMMAAADPGLQQGDALIVDTGWHRQWNKPGYVQNCPKMAPSALEWVLEQPIGLLGVDVPAIEAAWTDDDEGAKGGLLSALFERGCLLLAPLVNLDRTTGDTGRLIALPLPLAGVSGAPVRVVFEEPD